MSSLTSFGHARPYTTDNHSRTGAQLRHLFLSVFARRLPKALTQTEFGSFIALMRSAAGNFASSMYPANCRAHFLFFVSSCSALPEAVFLALIAFSRTASPRCGLSLTS